MVTKKSNKSKKVTSKVKAKPKEKVKKKIVEEEETISQKGMTEDELDEEIDEIERSSGVLSGNDSNVQIKGSKPITMVKKGDKVVIDGQSLEVDAHYVLIDHGSTKEMALELFDSKSDRDYQLRYFDDQAESTMEFYELQDIIYVKKQVMRISW